MNFVKELISVIVPVYNVEKYLKRCIESLLAQTYEKLEIILVDDGSTDSSGNICDYYAQNYKNIVVVHKENGGLSSARNKGLDKVSGEFIGFVDSDDWVHPSMYSILHDLLIDNNAEVSSSKYIFSDNKTQIDLDINKPIFVFQDEEIIEFYVKSSFENTIGEYPVWNKLYRREVFNNVRFEEGTIYEDILPNYKIMSSIKTFVKTTQPLYYYFKNNESITRNRLSSRDFYLLKICDKMIKCSYELGNVQVIKYVYLKKYRTYFSLLAKGLIYGYSDDIQNSEEITKELLVNLREHKKELLKSKIAISRKILIFFMCMSPTLTQFIGKFVKK